MEIKLEAVVERSCGWHNPHVVKHKMSRFLTNARAAPAPGQVFRYAEHIDRIGLALLLLPGKSGGFPSSSWEGASRERE